MLSPSIDIDLFSGGAHLAGDSGSPHLAELINKIWTVTKITSPKDLPAPSGGFIELPDQAVLLFEGTTHLPDDTGLKLGKNTVIMAQARRNGGVAANSDGPLIYGATDIEDLFLRDITLTQEGPGPIVEQDVMSTQACRMDRLRIFCAGGDVGAPAFDIFLMTNTIVSGFANGLTVGATAPTTFQVLTSLLIQSVGGSGNAVIDLGAAVLGSFRMRDGTYVTAASGVALKGLADGANLASGTGLADITGCRHTGLGSALSGITSQDIGYDFSKCVGIQNTATCCIRRMTANATTTDIVSNDTWTSIAGTSVIEVGGPRFDPFGDHGFQLSSRQFARARIQIAATINASALSTQEIGIFKNGSLSPASTGEIILSSGARTLVFNYIDDNPGDQDTWDVKIQRISGTADPNVQILEIMYQLLS